MDIWIMGIALGMCWFLAIPLPGIYGLGYSVTGMWATAVLGFFAVVGSHGEKKIEALAIVASLLALYMTMAVVKAVAHYSGGNGRPPEKGDASREESSAP